MKIPVLRVRGLPQDVQAFHDRYHTGRNETQDRLGMAVQFCRPWRKEYEKSWFYGWQSRTIDRPHLIDKYYENRTIHEHGVEFTSEIIDSNDCGVLENTEECEERLYEINEDMVIMYLSGNVLLSCT